MAWIRLDDDYVHHPKFTALSHGAFRLWHEGMAHCKKLLTNGFISRTYLAGFRYGKSAFVRELVTPSSPGASALWMEEAEGYRVHDYLDWNPSREEELQDREAAKKRMRAYRGRWRKVPAAAAVGSVAVTPLVTQSVTAFVTPDVRGRGQDLLLERESERKPFADARSRRPIFRGQRFVVFEWMLDDIRQVLGPYFEDFGLDQWFYALDARAQQLNLVMPKRDNGAWLQAQLLEEVARRGLKIAGRNGAGELEDSRLPHAWQCTKCGDVHEGTEAEARGGVCLRKLAAVR